MTGNSKKHRDAAPLVVVGMVKNAMRIIAMENDDRLSGIRPQQTLSDARAIFPGLECIRHDPHADKQLLTQILLWCERYTPLVSFSTDNGLFMDITGCAHLFGGEETMLDDVNIRLTAQGFAVQSAIADTAGAAWALAHYGGEKVGNQKTSGQKIARPNHHQAMLEPLPTAALRLSSAKATELARLGLKTIGCLINMPRAPITARFGDDVLRRLDQALGRADEVLCPFRPPAELVYEKRFAEPVMHEDDIKATIRRLAGQLQTSLEQRGSGLREAGLQLFRADGEVVHLQVAASAPLRDANRVTGLFDERLSSLHEEWDAGFGFDIIRLCVLHSDTLDAKQQSLVAHDDGHEAFAHLADRLSARLGADRVQVFHPADTHIPERSFGLVAATRHQAPPFAVHIAAMATRPIWLLERPEPAEVMAEVPEGPPLRFRWRKAHYEVSRSEGPERISCEWWKDGRAARTRDYFRVETREGYRLWLFRHGLYGRETDRPGWYVHGMFG